MIAARLTPRSRFLAAVAFSSALAGCTSVDDYQPYLVPRPNRIDAFMRMALDKKDCLAAAKGYVAPSPWQALGEATINGAADNAGPAAVTPLVLATGGAGGLTKAALAALGVTSTAQIKILNLCLATRGPASGTYDNFSPDQ